jgi:hypothetical protein
VCASFWLNAVVAHEVFVLLRKTQRLEAYTPPSRLGVLLRCLLVYTWAGFISSWHLWRVLPIRSLPLHGLVCLMLDYDLASTIFFWLAYVPAAAGAPTVYVVAVGYICWRDNLIGLPSPTACRASRSQNTRVSSRVSPAQSRHSSSHTSEQGEGSAWSGAAPSLPQGLPQRSLEQRSRQARALSVYFARIFLVFFVMWAPAITLVFVTSFRSPWPIWAGGVWAHSAGLVSALISMSKRDVWEAVVDLFSCGGRLRGAARISAAVDAAEDDGQCLSTITENDLSIRQEVPGGLTAGLDLSSISDENVATEKDG